MNDGNGAEFFAQLQPRHHKALFSSLSDQEQRAILYHWNFWARPEQLPPEGDWSVWLIMAGRGFGKTRAGAEWVRGIAESDGSARFALVGANYAETRTVMVEGESGLLSIAPPKQRPVWEPSLKRLTWENGAQAHLYSAAEPEGLRGPQHSHAWCDEIAKWMNNAGQAEAAWDNLKMGLRVGFRPQLVATTTPRPVAIVRALVNADGVAITRGRTQDNDLHLPVAFLTAMAADYGGTRLGRQELDGELIEELEGALWTRAMIEGCRVGAGFGAVRVERSLGTGDRPSRSLDFARDERGAGLVRVVIGVDPPASANGDACGIIVAGLGGDGKAYVLADCSVEKASPETWARAAARAADTWEADRVIAEANQGGAMVKSVLHAAKISLPVKLVHAARGKVARAEPVAALYENDRVHHVGAFPQLEDELCGLLIGGGYAGPGRSPDRADALVWALTELMLGKERVPRVR
ncbi:MAG: DNA-packaging protein [Sphingomonadales bacterium]|nr:DNA-packaging protein [Sphingomonadales bacterium]NCO49303.1 DNA-packaging protein [Sphingomonadales bacterium]NCO99475.1 DNA-packaging protein [Sphingomonadales bacterium]NCP27815.1 DNA-packaging protein [Sphingomonadales bacterium]NCP43037.1 DNA-packaging protein [Sphingomonadales bacterium]